jgi:hypothetical protein
VKAAAAGGTKSVPAGAAKARELPPPGKRVADFATDISVDDYLVGKSLARFFNLLIRCRVGRRPTCCCSACRGEISVGGEIPALTAVRDEAGAVSRRLKEALSQVS